MRQAGNWYRIILYRLGRILVLLVIVAALLVAGVWLLLTQPFTSPVHHTQSIAKADPARLEEHVRRLCEEFTPRDWTSTEKLDRTAEYIKDEFEKAGGRVSVQPFKAEGREYRNVIASFGPETGERVVVGAHYDAAGSHPGADDNASGVAGLIELAYMLGEEPPPVMVELVAYTLEEPPFFSTPEMGSAFHARSLKEQGTNVLLMISLEMIGYYSDQPGTQEYPHPVLKLLYPDKGNFIAVVGRLGQGSVVRMVKGAMKGSGELPVYSLSAPTFLPGIDFSDHRNYWDAGYDAVMVTDTSFFRNKRYHTPDDTPDTLDYKRMSVVVDGVHAAVVEAGRKRKR